MRPPLLLPPPFQQFSFPSHSHTGTLKPSLSAAMKDRPQSSYGAVYVPPHHRLRTVITVPKTRTNHSSADSSIESKLRDHRNPAVLCSKNGRTPSLSHSNQLLQKIPCDNKNNHSDEKVSEEYEFLFEPTYEDLISEDGTDRELDSVAQQDTLCYSSIDEWKQKLAMLLRDEGKQELVSTKKKDRRDFEKIAALAKRMSLYSHLYPKVAVFSKVPLPNYRFDLDDKRPKREVIIQSSLLKTVDACLGEFLSWKSKTKGSLPDAICSRSSGGGTMETDEGRIEQPELLVSSIAASEQVLRQRNLHLYDQQHAWQESSEGRRMHKFRQNLPAYKEKLAILTAISQNQVILLSGETGCGKTTQIPHFILESEIDAMRGAVSNIICTQPRRISAISVSERVAYERGEKLGETVGYKVRLEGMKGRDTHLLFCTTGILLRRLLHDRNLKGVTHVIVDEIHERGMNEDFLLIVLKDLLPRRPELKLILMSATLDAELFSSYFGGAPVIRIPGFTYPVRTHFLENILEMTGYRLTPLNQIDDYGQEKMWKMNKRAPRKRKSQIASRVEVALEAANLNDFSPQTLESLLSWNPDCIGFNLIEYLLSYICEKERPGSVLVFMTGWDDISSLKDKLQAHPVLGDPSRVLLLACHGSMASYEQRLIFEEPGNGVRKIVLATNIAETSITISDVVFVLDCGKAKETAYDALNNTPLLLPSWISKVSAHQRKGRAGRVQPGECYYLYPRCVYDAFSEYQLPEILRTPLQSLCLQIKSLKLGSISEFLSRALQSPELLAVQNAIEYLKVIGALDENEDLTVLGRYLTKLPMEPKLGKMLILGAILNCLDPILTVVAGLSVRDPFLNSLDRKDLAEAAKAQFSGDHSDHLAIVHAYNGWREAERDHAGHEYCWRNFLSAQSMRAIDSLRKEFLSLLKDTVLVDGSTTNYNAWSHDVNLIRAIICFAFYPGVCSVVHSARSFSLKTMEDGQVLLSSNSVNAREPRIPYPWLVFNEKIKVNSIILRDCTAVSDSMLLLFGGCISRGDTDGHLKMLGGYLEFFMTPDVAEMHLFLRNEFDELIQNKLLNPRLDVTTHHELLSAIQLLISYDQCEGRFVVGHRPSKNPVTRTKPTVLKTTSLRTKSGPGGDNPKSQLQTLLIRAGHAKPVYKTMKLMAHQFQAIVEFNGMQISSQLCTSKKSAEMDAAAEALQWLLGETWAGHEYINHMSLFLKRSKSNH